MSSAAGSVPLGHPKWRSPSSKEAHDLGYAVAEFKGSENLRFRVWFSLKDFGLI